MSFKTGLGSSKSFASRRALQLQKTSRQRRRQSLQLETLEQRDLMAVWVGPAGGNWGDAGNWNTADVPDTAGETADFTGTNPGNINVNGTFNVGSVSFTAGGYTLSGGGLNVASGGSITNATGTNTIGSNLTSGGAINVNANGGLLTLSGANSYTGNTTVNSGGIMRVTGVGSLPTDVTVNSGGTFDVNSQNLNTRSFTIAGTGTAGQTGALVNTTGGTEASVANVTLTADARIGTTGSKLNIFGATIQGNGNRLTTAGNGETNIRIDNALTNLSGVTVSSGLLRMESSQNYTGTITVNSGATVDTWATRTIASSVTLQGGTLAANGGGTATWTGSVTVSNNSIVNTNGTDINLNGNLAGGAQFTKSGGNTLRLGGAGTGFTGPIAVNTGILQLNSTTGLSATSGVTVASGATFDFNNKGNGSSAGNRDFFIAGTGTAGQGALVNTVAGGGSTNNVTLTAIATIGTPGRMDTFGQITGNFALTKIGGDVLSVRGGVSGLNALNVNAGRVRFENTGFGAWAGPINVNAGGILSGWTNQTTGVAVNLNGGTLAAENNGTNTWNGPISVVANSTLDTGGGNHIINGALSGGANLNTTGTNQLTVNVSGSVGSISGNAPLSVTGGATLAVGSNNASSVYTGVVSGAGTLAKNGTGTLTVNRTNTLSGNWQVNSGTLYAAGPGSLGTANVAENGGTLILAPTVTSLSGFGGSGTGWTLNSGATAAADVLTITTAANSLGRTAFFNERVSTGAFNASFIYNNPNTAAVGADGFTFTLQSDPRGSNGVGAAGGGLGYTGLTPSVAVAINLYRGAGGGRGLDIFTNGVASLPYELTSLVGNGTPLNIAVAYDGTNLSVTVSQGASTFTYSQAINLSSLLGSSAFLGFTGGTGGENALQTISNFSYQATTPSASHAIFNNSISVLSGATGNTQVRGTPFNPTITVNNLDLAAGSTHNISAAAGTPANAAYGLTLAGASLNGGTTLNIANNGSGLGNATFSGSLNGGGSLTKGGSGQLTLLASSGYGGGTIITGGRVLLQNAGGFGSGTVNVGAGTYVMLWFNTGSNTITNNWVLNGIGATQSGEQKDSIYGDGGGAGYREYVLSGQITLNSTSNIGGNDSNNITVTGRLTGAGGLTKGGTRGDENNTLVLANPLNDYAGATTIVQGRIRTVGNEVIPNGPGVGGVTINAGRYLDLGNYTETINSLSGSGDVIRSGAAQGITTFATDAASGISTSKAYTHALDFAANGSPAVVNGLTFTDAGTSGSNWSVNAPNVLTGAPSFSGSAGLDAGGMRELFSDFLYNGNPAVLNLTGLSPGTTYELRLYNRVWGAPRTQFATFDNDGAGPNSTFVTFEQDGNATPNYLSYRYTATTTTLTVSFLPTAGSGTYHFYGLTNEVVPTGVLPSLIVGDSTSSTYSGVVRGAGQLVKQGSGTLTLASPQAYTGDTTVAAGTLRTGGDEIIPHGPTAGDLIVNGTLDLGLYQETVNALSGSGNVVRNSIGGILSPVFFNSDAASGISTAKTYTHLLDFISDGTAAVVNGVPFTPAGQSGVNWNLSPGGLPNVPEASGGTAGLPTQLDDNGMEKLYRDFYYNGNPATLTLSGLTAGVTYEVHLFNRQWGPDNRTQLFTFDPDGAGSQSDQVFFNSDNLTPNYLAYRFTAVSDGLGGALPLTVSTLQQGIGTYHWYGVTNEVVAPPTLTIGDDGNSNFSGAIAGNGSLVKQGTGTQTLSGNNTYSGSTAVNVGTLLVNGSVANGPLNVQTGATLGGTGSIGGNVSVANGGTINPGTPSDTTDDLVIGGNLTLAAGAVLVADINSAADYDQIVLTGATSVATVGGAVLDLNIVGNQTPGGRYVLVNNTANSNAVVGTFAGRPEQFRFTDSNPTEFYRISYVYNAPGAVSSGNDIVLLRNNYPLAVNETFTAPRNTAITNNVLVNSAGGTDSDPDGDTISVLPVVLTTANGGLVQLQADGTFVYTPATDYLGPDSFDYTLTDGELIDIGTVNINVSAVFVDPLDPTTLVVSGASGPDRIIVNPASSGKVSVRLNNVLSPTFSGIAKVVAYGNAGDDVITTGTNFTLPVEFYGGEDNDYLAGGNGNDLLDGGEGTDRLLGGNGNDTLLGGGGADTVSGGAGNDYVSGDDYVDLIGGTLLDDLSLSLPGDILTSSNPGRDTLSGDAGNDIIYGGALNDTLNGGLGNDQLFGGADNDTLSGDDGIDLLAGEAGNDTLYGRAGNDVLIGGEDLDTLLGGTGIDLVFGDEADSGTMFNAWSLWALGGNANQTSAANLLAATGMDDGIADKLNGEGDVDWYLIFSDLITVAAEKKAPNIIRQL